MSVKHLTKKQRDELIVVGLLAAFFAWVLYHYLHRPTVAYSSPQESAANEPYVSEIPSPVVPASSVVPAKNCCC